MSIVAQYRVRCSGCRLWMQTRIPGLCAQCAGWGREDSLDLGDEWEVAEKEDGTPEIYNLDEDNT